MTEATQKIWHEITQIRDGVEQSHYEARAGNADGRITTRLVLRYDHRSHLWVALANGATVFAAKTLFAAKKEANERYELYPWVARKYSVTIDIQKAVGWREFSVVAASEEEAIQVFHDGETEFVDEDLQLDHSSDPYITSDGGEVLGG